MKKYTSHTIPFSPDLANGIWYIPIAMKIKEGQMK